MPHPLPRLVGHKVLSRARKRGWLDTGLGFALLRDRRVSVGSKVLALTLGILLTAGLEVLELPMEAVLAMLVPVLGLGFDTFVDGVEALVLPFVFAAILLPHLTPKDAAIVRSERA